MDWKELGRLVVEKGAPLLGGVLGGPGGAALGGVVASMFGGDPENPKALAQAIQGNPDAAVKLRELEARHQERLEELALEEKRAYLADRQDARARDVSLAKAKGGNWRGDALAVIAILGLVALILALLFVQIPQGPARDVLLMLSGGLVAIVKDVYAFEFGSSRGSKDKDAALAQINAQGAK